MSSNKMSAKEREILANQRRLAAKLKPPPSSDKGGGGGGAMTEPQQLHQYQLQSKGLSMQLTNSTVTRTIKAPPPPPPPPFLLKCPSSAATTTAVAPSNGVSSMTTASVLSKFGMKPPSIPAPKQQQQQRQHPLPQSQTAIMSVAPGEDLTTTTTTTTISTTSSSIIRPKLKRPTAAAAALAAKQRQEHLLQLSGAAAAKDDEDQKKEALAASSPSPALAKKKKTKPSGTGSLSQLMQNMSSTSAAAAAASEAAVFQTVEPEDFWKHLRDWDFCSQYYESQQQQNYNSNNTNSNDKGGGNNNNNNNKADKEKDASALSTMRPLPNIFLSAKQYVALWAPLCLAECRAGLLQEVTGNNRGRNKSIAVHIEVMQEPFKSGSKSKQKEHSNWDALALPDTAMHLKINASHRNEGGRVDIMPNDLVLLLPAMHANFLARPSADCAGCGIVGHSEVARKGLQNLIVKVSKRKWAKHGQAGDGRMHMVVIGSNVTAWREFTALTQVAQLPMKRFLLGEHLESPGQVKKLSKNNTTEQLLEQMGGQEALGKGFLEYCRTKFNPSQLTAIAASAHEYGEGGFTLIKGPPGTGKTTTLCAVLNSLHIRQYNKYYAEVRRIASDPSGSRQNALQFARKSKPRLLVCAPSNAAVDNIILKIMQDGFIDGQGQRYNPSMIRVGVGQSGAVRAVALETKVEQIMGENLDISRLDSTIAAYRVELSRVTQDIHKLRDRLQVLSSASPWPLSRDWEIRIDETAEGTVPGRLCRVYFVNHKEKKTTYEVPPPPEPDETQFPATSMPEYRAYVSRIVKLVEQYFTIKTHLERCTIVKSGQDQGANHFDLRQNLETHVLNDVHIVMTTLGTAGNRTLDGCDKFEVVVVDEAAQSVEPATLSALQLGSRHAVLVGDPQQLPATIFNVSGRHSKFDRSLFQRLEEAGQPVYMLQEQYRMHPQISHFPRHIFYGGTLLDGPNVTKPEYGNRLRAVLQCAVPQFQPFSILDLDSHEERGGTSLSNDQEAQLAVYLYEQLRQFGRELCTESKVAIITPYAQQVGLLRRLFQHNLGDEYERYVEINSVDAFQGREANIVIFSAVRAAGSKGIGFLSDVRRMNVALTRAKHFLFVICRCESVVVNPYWRDLVNHARAQQAVLRVPKLQHGNNNRGNGAYTFGSPIQWKFESAQGNNLSFAPAGRMSQLPPPPPPPPPPPLPASALEEPTLGDPRLKNRKRGASTDPRKSQDSPEQQQEQQKQMEYAESNPSFIEPPKKPLDPRLAGSRNRQMKKARH